MKWYWLNGVDSRSNLYLISQLNGDRVALLERFRGLKKCRRCEKYDETEIFSIGFDTDRLLPVESDVVGNPFDLPATLVSEDFVSVIKGERISGLAFTHCGRSRRHGKVYVMQAEAEAHCMADPSMWCRKRPYPDYEDEACEVCGRTVHVVGLPYQFQLALPGSLTVAVPSVRTEIRSGRDFRFFCSGAVRQVFKSAGLKGLSFTDLQHAERWFPPPYEGG